MKKAAARTDIMMICVFGRRPQEASQGDGQCNLKFLTVANICILLILRKDTFLLYLEG